MEDCHYDQFAVINPLICDYVYHEIAHEIVKRKVTRLTTEKLPSSASQPNSNTFYFQEK